MTDIWSGNILLPDNNAIRGIYDRSLEPAAANEPQKSALRRKIPRLHLPFPPRLYTSSPPSIPPRYRCILPLDPA
jgi:hypothetical protein